MQYRDIKTIDIDKIDKNTRSLLCAALCDDNRISYGDLLCLPEIIFCKETIKERSSETRNILNIVLNINEGRLEEIFNSEAIIEDTLRDFNFDMKSLYKKARISSAYKLYHSIGIGKTFKFQKIM